MMPQGRRRRAIRRHRPRRTERLRISYRTIEVVERIGSGDAATVLGTFETEEEAIGQALALHGMRGGYLRVERVETRVIHTIGKPTMPRIVVPGSTYYATSLRGDGFYRLQSERDALPEIILFTFRRQARVVMQAIANAAKGPALPF